jgi:ATP-dependent Lhr-like helicase
VQRGYFVAGLAGAQFALADAVEMLRAPASETPEEPVVLATSDPANVYSLQLEGVERDRFTRPRGTGAYLVTVGGVVVLAVEGRGRRLNNRPDVDEPSLRSAVAAFVKHATRGEGVGRHHDLIIETINGEPAGGAPIAPLLMDLGLRREGGALRRYATIR